MQPGMAGRLDAKGQERIMAMIATVAGETAPRWRAHEVAVQPFNNAAGEGAGLGPGARQAAIELGDASPL